MSKVEEASKRKWMTTHQGTGGPMTVLIINHLPVYSYFEKQNILLTDLCFQYLFLMDNAHNTYALS